MKIPIVAANWKMHKTIGEAIDLAAEVKRRLADVSGVETVLCPPFTALKSVGDLLGFGSLRLGAQEMHWEPQGAYTGAISAAMLKDLGCRYVIVGHSERRTHFHETDESVNRKARAALAAGLHPIVCVGETLEQREAGRTEEVVRNQVERALHGLEDRVPDLVIAYEPVWAIGTGKNATPDQAQEVHERIRARVRSLAGAPAGNQLRIQYGGSVKPSNAAELFRLPDVDGGLIGGASLDAASFVEIVQAAAQPD